LAVGISLSFADVTRDSVTKKDSIAAFLRNESVSGQSPDSTPLALRVVHDTGSTRIKNLDKMVVFAKRSPLQTVLEAKDFLGKFQDLQSVLQTVSGVTVRSIGGFGHYAVASIRGSSPNQVQVYLDGIPLNGSTGNAVDLSKIPLTSLQKITIYKNSPSIEIFGENAGGVISLTTSENTNVTDASGEVGSFGFRSASALIGKKIGAMMHRFSINYGYSDDNYPYVNNRGTTVGPHAGDDDTLETMDNNSFSSLSSMYSNTWDFSSACNLTSQLSATVTDEGLFYFPQADSNDGHIRKTKLYLIESFHTNVGQDMSVSISAQGKTENELFQRFRPFYLYASPSRHDIDQPFGSLEAVIRKQFGPNLAVKGVLHGSYDGFTYRDLYLPDNRIRPHFYRLSGRAGAEADLSIDDKLSARGGGLYRYEVDSTNGKFYFSGFQPGGSSSFNAFPNGFAEITYAPGKGVSVSAGARRTSRSPGFSEKYSVGADYVGNADLRPETRSEYDVGFSLNKPIFSITGSLFASSTRDKIVFVMNSVHMFVPENLDHVTGWGVESDITLTPCDWIALTNNGTYMENTIHSSGVSSWTGNDEPFLPRFTDDFGIQFTYKKFYAGHTVHFMSPYFLGPDNVDLITHPRPEMTATIGIVPDKSRHFDLSYRLENYLNVQDYDFPDSPLPGIRYFLVLKYNF